MSDLEVALRLVIIGVLLVCSGFFSSSETALFSLNKLQLRRMKQGKTARGDTILMLLDRPKRLLITILLGNEFVNISIAAISASLVINFLGNTFPGIDIEWLNILIVVPILLMFGEVLPKSMALKHNEKLANLLCTPLNLFRRGVWPLVELIFKFAGATITSIAGHPSKHSAVSEEEFLSLLDESHKAGIIGEQERGLVMRVFDLGKTPVSEIMKPRGSLFSLPYEMPFKKMIYQVSEHLYSAVPIYEKEADHIIGILYAKSLLSLTPQEILEGKTTLDRILVKPMFIPETKPVYDLFREFRFKKNQMAIVLDEFGGVVGVVTLDDILEELFGKINDRLELNKTWKTRGENCWVVSATTTLEELSEMISVNVQSEDLETVGGFIFSLFGHLPSKGESIDYENLRFTVEDMDFTKILEIKIEKFPQPLATVPNLK